MIFDFHCHYSPEFFRYRDYRMDLDALIAEMDRHCVARAVLGPAGEYAAYATDQGNAFVRDATRRFPSRFVSFPAPGGRPGGPHGTSSCCRRALRGCGA
jgi:hypothetical protein